MSLTLSRSPRSHYTLSNSHSHSHSHSHHHTPSLTHTLSLFSLLLPSLFSLFIARSLFSLYSLLSGRVKGRTDPHRHTSNTCIQGYDDPVGCSAGRAARAGPGVLLRHWCHRQCVDPIYQSINYQSINLSIYQSICALLVAL